MSSAPQGPAPAAKPQVRALNCSNCGAALTLRSFDHAVTIVCAGCHSILDAQDPDLRLLQQFKVAVSEDKPLIPLGSRGRIRGTVYEVTGFMRRTIHVDGISYMWHEYLIFNPYQGFRYLTEYQGHWNDISICKALPKLSAHSDSAMNYLGEDYKHFQTAEATTSFVLGEFPWQVRVGEQATVTDYVKPPRVLSSERYRNEVTWSLGEYTEGKDVWQAFGLPGDPPEACGVYENQPSPMSASATSIWVLCGWFLLILLCLFLAFGIVMRNELVFAGSYYFGANASTEASFVTDTFKLEGRTSNVQVNTATNVLNNWIYLNYALISQDSGEAWDFGREVSYYTGYDSDGRWSEGKQNDTVVIPSVPPGNYYLRIEPESDRRSTGINYTVSVRRDVPVLGFFGIAFVALVLPAAIVTWRFISFEHLRWAESDHPPRSWIPTQEES